MDNKTRPKLFDLKLFPPHLLVWSQPSSLAPLLPLQPPSLVYFPPSSCSSLQPRPCLYLTLTPPLALSPLAPPSQHQDCSENQRVNQNVQNRFPLLSACCVPGISYSSLILTTLRAGTDYAHTQRGAGTGPRWHG